MAHILIRMTSAPYGSALASDGLDFALGATNYGHEVTMVFVGDGVFQLQSHQQPSDGIKSQQKRLSALPFYDIEELYACEVSLQSRSVAPESEDIRVASSETISRLLRDADHVVTF